MADITYYLVWMSNHCLLPTACYLRFFSLLSFHKLRNVTVDRFLSFPNPIYTIKPLWANECQKEEHSSATAVS